jgi:hypothetical protein
VWVGWLVIFAGRITNTSHNKVIDYKKKMWKTVLITTAVSCLLFLTSTGDAAGDSTASSSTLGSTDEPARLLISKTLLNKYVVESMDVVIKYSVFNVGSVTATNVELKDGSFGPDFKVVGGNAEVNLGRIPPAANVSHTLVVRPIKFGYYNFTAAQVTYKSGDESSEVWDGDILYIVFVCCM